MNRNKEFAKNTFLLFIGKFATQFMSLLLLPLFTHYLLAEDYGIVDLLQTYITLFVPVLTLRVDSAVFRFLIDKRKNNEEQKNIISNIIIILFVSIVITICFAFVLNMFVDIKYYFYVVINIVVLMISNILLQVLRGIGKTKEYSIASIITGAVTLIVNILLILVYNFAANSILISSICANIVCSIYVYIKVDLKKLFSKKKINKKIIKQILNYSLPMIPNALSWWVVNVSDRTIITFFIGAASNGIYTVSCKFSNILNSIFSIFNMSWQESASLHINDDDKDYFFTDMINKILMLFSSFSILILVIIPIFFDMLIGSEYLSSYNYIPILLYANTWNVLICLVGGIYVAVKKTKEIATTTIISAIINILVHLFLIKKIGLYAACISTLVSYLVMAIYRSIDCKRFVNFKLDIKGLIIYTIVFLISSLLYVINNVYLNIVNLILIVIYCILMNKNNIVDMLKLFKIKKTK